MTTHITSSDPLTLDTIAAAIQRGDVDDHLDQIELLVKQRRRDAAAKIAPGDEGVTAGLSPKYLNGAPCKVLEWRKGKLVLEIPESWWAMNPQAARFKQLDGTVLAPPQCFRATS